MKGLRLFVRPLDSSDASDLAEFLSSEGVVSPPPACGLLAKMLGRIVAVAGFEIEPDGLRLDSLLVTGQLRRKRIGRAMIRELRDFAVKVDRSRIYVVHDAASASPDSQAFLRGVGFISQEDRWVLSAG